jgi:hypothetical protein
MTDKVLSETEIWENGNDGTDTEEALRIRHERKTGRSANPGQDDQKELPPSKPNNPFGSYGN